MLICLSVPAFAKDKIEADTDPTYERRLELAKEMHEIWPTRLKVEQALDRATVGLPEERRAAFKAAMRKAIKYKVLEEDSIDAMVKLFTVEELEDMVKFYGSSNGRAVSLKIDAYQAEIAPSFTRMMDKALMDIKTGSAPGDIR